MFHRSFLAIAMSSTVALASQFAPADQPTTINGIDVACTGASLDTREDVRWADYPLRVELVGEKGRYLGGADFRVSREGKDVLRVSCGGPWLLLRLPAGRYEIEVNVSGQIMTSKALVPSAGQARLILRFLE